MIGPAMGLMTPGTLLLRESDSSSTTTPSGTCRYAQYELSRHRKPRSPPPASAIFVATLRLVVSASDWRWNVIVCSVS